MAAHVDPTGSITPLSLTRNQDLSAWSFAVDEIKSLCENHRRSGVSVNEFRKRHNLSYSTMKRYAATYKVWRETGVDNFHSSHGGRPALIDNTGIIVLRQFLRANLESQNCQLSMIAPFHLKVEAEVDETRKRKDLAAVDRRLSKRTIHRFKEANSFTEVDCQFKTNARSAAEGDPRNLYSFAAMNEAFVSGLAAPMCFNSWHLLSLTAVRLMDARTQMAVL